MKSWFKSVGHVRKQSTRVLGIQNYTRLLHPVRRYRFFPPVSRLFSFLSEENAEQTRTRFAKLNSQPNGFVYLAVKPISTAFSVGPQERLCIIIIIIIMCT